ncbi:hypothetical protein JCM11491_004315 [Sporobolomyces phaffii]
MRRVVRGVRTISTTTTATQSRWLPPPRGTTVYACMSGGVDSSVAAKLLVDQGFDVKPVFMRNWDTLDEQRGSGGCEWERDFADVQRVCRDHLGGITPELIDLSREYWQHVFEPALESWELGRTPNPDVTCNQKIKFRALPDRLLARDPTAWIATGHYARLAPSPLDPSEPALLRATCAAKDQSHYLSTAPLAALERTLFPLGAFASKDAVRDLARAWDLHTQDKRESMGICFVGVRKGFSRFLDSYIPPRPGNIETLDGKVVGRHQGLWTYTFGEGARVSGLAERLFVARKDVERNCVVVVPKNSPLLRCTALSTRDFSFVSTRHPPPPELDSATGFACEAQARSLPNGSLSDCVVRRALDGSIKIRLETPLVGVASGQTVALYRGAWCLGGGTIDSVETLADRDLPL